MSSDQKQTPVSTRYATDTTSNQPMMYAGQPQQQPIMYAGQPQQQPIMYAGQPQQQQPMMYTGQLQQQPMMYAGQQQQGIVYPQHPQMSPVPGPIYGNTSMAIEKSENIGKINVIGFTINTIMFLLKNVS